MLPTNLPEMASAVTTGERYLGEAAGEQPVSEAENPADIRYAAMNLLARREHSLEELRIKLGRRFSDKALLDRELDRLTKENLQSDSRYADSFARQRAQRGYGPMRLRQEMRQKGLSDEQVSQAFGNADLDWWKLAQEVYQKKFGTAPPADIKERSKRVRFMQYRGFTMEHLEGLLD